MKDAYIVAMGRSAMGKSGKGTLRTTRPEDIAAQVLKGVMAQIPSLPSEQIDDVMLGCSYPESSQGLNVARTVALMAGLDVSVPGQTINRFCSSGLQSIATATNCIVAGQADVIVAGGLESMSAIPFGGRNISPHPGFIQEQPDLYATMGITAENVAERYNVSREDQDEFSLKSHHTAQAARNNGRLQDGIIPIQATVTKNEAGATVAEQTQFDCDEGIRDNLTIEALQRLRPAFKVNGTVTAGNSSQTSDGAAFVVIMSEEKLREFDLTPIGKLTGFSVAGLEPGIMGMGPVYAIPKVLNLTSNSLSDIELIELNEAFASQAVACMRELDLDEEKVNVNGGAIALGHPLGCTGTALTVKLLSEMRYRKLNKGMVSMCIGGGMGAAGVFELQQ